MNSESEKPAGAFFESKFRMNDSATWVSVRSRPRAVSTMTLMSFMNWSRLKNCVMVDHSIVFRLATTRKLEPQFGWQEHESAAELGPSGPCSERMWSASALKAPMAPSGYQSR